MPRAPQRSRGAEVCCGATAPSGHRGAAWLYSPAMTDEPDLEELARRFFDLWQEQVTALATDREVAEATERWLQAMGAAAAPAQGMPGGAPAPWLAWPAAMMAAMNAAGHAGVPGAAQAWGGDGRTAGGFPAGPFAAAGASPNPGDGAGSGAASGAAAGSAASAGAPDDGAGDVDELRQRLAALEERIAALEAKPGRGRGASQGRSRKRRA